MSRRLFRRAAPLALASLAAAAAASYYISRPATSDLTAEHHPSRRGFYRNLLVESSQALLAAKLRTQPLSGARVRAVRRQAEHDLTRLEEEGDAPAAADLRLVLAFLDARDGRFDEALEAYAQVARDHPFDPRPRALAAILCGLVGRVDESISWQASYRRLPRGAHDGLVALADELVIAAALGGARYGFFSGRNSMTIVRAACRELDEAITSTLQDKELSMAERLVVRAMRLFLHLNVRLALMKMEEEKKGQCWFRFRWR